MLLYLQLRSSESQDQKERRSDIELTRVTRAGHSMDGLFCEIKARWLQVLNDHHCNTFSGQ